MFVLLVSEMPKEYYNLENVYYESIPLKSEMKSISKLFRKHSEIGTFYNYEIASGTFLDNINHNSFHR
jgi:hypothetical protein